MAEPRFTDPELTAIWNFLRTSPTPVPSPADLARGTRRRTPDAQAIAAREGLDLGPELRRVLRRRPQQTKTEPRPASPTETAPGNTPQQRGSAASRAVERSRVMRLIAQLAPGLRHHQLRERTTAWDALKLTAPELETWMRALGVDGAAAARACRALGIGPAALDVVLDGRQVRRRLREGTTVTALLALAAERGIDLRRR
ncbi:MULTISPECIES: hypothetical protein [Streptomyces]|uniref:Uncharacterized protein n=1 Tax=Streptomyces zinciresistens K42 TaxID=700597 RepID=G2G656_9ACTN|nr:MULTISPECIES: hypothetical protein [Streptomyces]EGX61145.1 hypothetical protein SZN_04811 [Streptomyces zinciresistens K42]MDT9696665.1 hypothetical protein [Streptomyces sp. P17]